MLVYERCRTMRNLIILGILALLVVGCVSVPGTSPPATSPTTQPATSCTNVSEEVPIITQNCQNVSDTQHVCVNRQLEYSSNILPNVNLCVDGGACTDEPIQNCPSPCEKIMTSCKMVIKNKEPLQPGSWTVDANFTLNNAGFDKGPMSQTIAANSSAEFDFYEIYAAGSPVSTATCSIAVSSVPTIEDCHDVTTMKTLCTNVSSTQTVEKQVCS